MKISVDRDAIQTALVALGHANCLYPCEMYAAAINALKPFEHSKPLESAGMFLMNPETGYWRPLDRDVQPLSMDGVVELLIQRDES